MPTYILHSTIYLYVGTSNGETNLFGFSRGSRRIPKIVTIGELRKAGIPSDGQAGQRSKEDLEGVR